MLNWYMTISCVYKMMLYVELVHEYFVCAYKMMLYVVYVGYKIVFLCTLKM